MKIECLMHDYKTKIIVDAPNEYIAGLIAVGEYAKQYGNASIVEAFRRIE